MTTDMQSSTQSTDQKSTSLGARLQAAREALNLDRKEAAAQLRLNEKVILMIEKDRYATDIPLAFIRGYIRSYGKLLKIPEHEMKKAVDLLKFKTTSATATVKTSSPVTSGNYFMQLFSLLILFTLAGLAGTWWYTNHNIAIPTTATVATEARPANSAQENTPTTVSNADPLSTAPTEPEPTNTAATQSVTEQPTEELQPAAAIEQLLDAQTQQPNQLNTSPSPYTQSMSPANQHSATEDVEIYNNNAE